MDLTHWSWVAIAAYAIQMMEEFMLDWRDWARAVIGLPVEWPDFFVTNGIVVVLGIAAANLAGVAPVLALAFPALMLIDAVFFHTLPILWARGRFSPGAITAVVLFLPIGVSCYRSGDLGWGTVIGSAVLGAALMATPIPLPRLKGRACFRQDRA